MKFGGIVLQINSHRLTSCIFDLTSYFQDSGHDVISQRCCYPVSAHEASARRLCSSVRQLLIYSTFAFVILIHCMFLTLYLLSCQRSADYKKVSTQSVALTYVSLPGWQISSKPFDDVLPHGMVIKTSKHLISIRWHKPFKRLSILERTWTCSSLCMEEGWAAWRFEPTLYQGNICTFRVR